MTIWVLFMVLLNPEPGFHSQYALPPSFNTPEACQIERNRIGFDMAEAYPYDMDFRIECQKIERETPLKAPEGVPMEPVEKTQV